MAYAPAANTTQSAGLTHQASVFYNKVGLDKLFATLRFQSVCEADSIPRRSGKTVQWFRFSLLGANTAPASEGVIGLGIPLTSATISASVEQYSDFTSLSTFLNETAINEMVKEASEEMSYRAALTVDNITRAEIDAGPTVLTSLGSYLALNDFRRAVSVLQARNVAPKEGNDFIGVVHPYNLYDIKSESGAGGFLDAVRYTNGDLALQGEAGRIAQVRLLSTTNVGDDGVAATSTKYYSYVFGKGGVGAVSLAGSGPSNVVDPRTSMFSLMVTPGGNSPADPVGEIGTYVGYRFVYVAKILDATNYRFVITKADSSIV
jgi:N4-gp56 family major capsid protein